MSTKESSWSYSTGEAGRNRVRVFEREPGSPISVSWRDDDGRHRKSLRALTGAPIRDRGTAREVAERVAASLAEGRVGGLSLRELAGLPAPHTLAELYDALFEEKAEEWSEDEKTLRRETREFWCEWLGPDRLVHTVSPMEVRTAVKELPGDYTLRLQVQRTYMECILELFRFGCYEKNWLHWSESLPEVVLPGDPGWDPRPELEIMMEEVDLHLQQESEEL